MAKLILVKRGCDFMANDLINQVSDLGNHRLTTTHYAITGKDGIEYHVEFGHADKYNVRRMTKDGTRTLKHPVKTLEKSNKLYVDACYIDNDGRCLGTHRFAQRVWDNNDLEYTKEGILATVNMLSEVQYDDIEIITNEGRVNHV